MPVVTWRVVPVRLTYLLARVALLVGVPCLVGVLAPGPSAAATWGTWLASRAVAAALLAVEARRDLYLFAQFAVVALLFPLTFPVAAWVVAGSDVAS
jgi:hypothetical protein